MADSGSSQGRGEEPEALGGGPPPGAGEPGGAVAFNSKTIGNNPYIPYLSIDTRREHPKEIILIQDTPEIQSVLSQIQIIKQQQSVLDTINQAVKDAIGLIIP